MIISLVEFEDLKFHENNPGYIKKIYDHRYKDTNFSIIQEGKTTWIIYVIDEEVGIFELLDAYRTKRNAIEDIESGRLKIKLAQEKILLEEIIKVI